MLSSAPELATCYVSKSILGEIVVVGILVAIIQY